MTELNENIKKHIKPFLSMKQENKGDVTGHPFAKTFIKPDGTKVTIQKADNGETVTEIHKDGTVVVLNFDNREVLRQDYTRRLNVEIVHHYDELSLMLDELMNIFDENNKLAKKTEKFYKYHDNKKKKEELIINYPGEVKTYFNYDENEKLTGKLVHQGTVKTWYDSDNKPIKRELDRGAGGIIVEDLTK